MENTEEFIVKTIEDIADIPADEISFESAFIDDLNLASIEIMSIVAEVERKYSIKIAESELLEIRTVSDLVKVIESKVAQN